MMKLPTILSLMLVLALSPSFLVVAFSPPSFPSQYHLTAPLQAGTRLSNRYLPNTQKASVTTLSSSSDQPQPTNNNGNLSMRQIMKNFITIFQKLLYPHTIPASTTKEPLPDGTLGCPFFGHILFSGDRQAGPGSFWRKMSAKLNNPGIFKCFSVGTPMVALYGGSNMKNLLEREFKSPEKGGVMMGSFTENPAVAEIIGAESLGRSTEKGEHSSLRKLVGQSMTPSSVSKSIPQLVKGAELAIEEMLHEKNSEKGVVMEDICTQYTLDVAWRQILGLDLTEEEVPIFHKNVNRWILGVINPLLSIFPAFVIRKMECYKAWKYLNNLIISQIAELKRNGPDGSTLSAMVFATEDDNADNTGSIVQNQKLTVTQIVDNALMLILAGSETSASTLTTAMLFFGMYPEMYKQIQEEQQQLQIKYADNDQPFTRQMIDEEMPLLDAFIRETMRIKPLSVSSPRIAKETMVIDGKQIPKNWVTVANIELTHANDPVTIQTDGEGINMDIYNGFNPSRWLNEETKPRDWMPFGYGPRFCLGYNLAMAEMKIFLALVARNLDFSLVNGTNDIKWQRVSIIPKPLDGTLIRAEKRD